MIGPRFSAAAETYDRHARPQLALAQSVVSMLPEMYPEQILELALRCCVPPEPLLDKRPNDANPTSTPARHPGDEV